MNAMLMLCLWEALSESICKFMCSADFMQWNEFILYCLPDELILLYHMEDTFGFYGSLDCSKLFSLNSIYYDNPLQSRSPWNCIVGIGKCKCILYPLHLPYQSHKIHLFSMYPFHNIDMYISLLRCNLVFGLLGYFCL